MRNERIKREMAAPAINTEWFRTMLRQNRISQRKLAKGMSLDPAAVSLILRGKRKLQLDEARQMADILKVSINDVLLAAGIPSVSHPEAVGMQEVLRRLIKHSTAHIVECTNRGEIANAQVVMDDVSAAMTLLDTILKK